MLEEAVYLIINEHRNLLKFVFILIYIQGKEYIYIYIYKGVDVVEWSWALDVRLSEWCCSVSMVWVQFPSREEQTFDLFKI